MLSPGFTCSCNATHDGVVVSGVAVVVETSTVSCAVFVVVEASVVSFATSVVVKASVVSSTFSSEWTIMM